MLLALLCKASVSNAQEDVRVGVLGAAAPFSWQENGKFYGVSVSLWESIARSAQLRSHMVAADSNIGAAISELESGKFDVLVGPISVTDARFSRLRFSRPYFLNHFALVVHAPLDSRWSALLHSLKEPALTILPLVCSLIVLMTIAFYYIDYNNTRDTRGRKLFHAFWEVVVILIQCEVFGETRSTLKKILSLLWLLMSIGLLSLLIGTVSSAFSSFNTQNAQYVTIRRADLDSKTIAVVRGSASEQVVRLVGATPIFFNNTQEALEAVAQGTVFGYIDDYLILKKGLTHYTGVRMTQLHIKNDEIAFAVRRGKESLLEKIDAQIVAMQDDGRAEGVCRNHLGDDARLCVL